MIHGQQMLLEKDLQQVVSRLHKEETSVEPYREDYRRILDNQGKMIRAALVLLFARANPEESNQPFEGENPAVIGAAAIEMLHLATLVHDDVLDNAETRRGQPTLHTIHGNKAAIYLGDLILSRYMEIMASIANSTDFVQEQASTVCEIVGGELLQESARGNIEVSLAHYKRAIQGKTAALFRLACTTGVKLSVETPANNELLKAARDFGEHMGMAFQMIDDICDFNVDYDSGKPKLEDINEQIYTIPVILGLQSDPSLQDILRLQEPEKVLAYLQEHPELIKQSKDAAREEIAIARQALSQAPIKPSVSSLLKELLDKLSHQI